MRTTTAATWMVLAACLLLAAGLAAAQDKGKADKTKLALAAAADSGGDKAVSGMSIVGNSETPKSLTIIPWKSSEIGRDTDFKSSLLGQDIVPIDKPSFLRELDFYKLSARN